MVKGYGARIKQLILDLGAARGARLTLSEFGSLVAKAEKRVKPYTATGVSSWIRERATPSIMAFAAMEKVAGREKINRPAVWLAFGVNPKEDA